MSVRRSARPDVLVRFTRASAFDDPAVAAWAMELLDDEERRTLARFRPAAARRDYLAAHAIARATLAELVDAAPAALRFRRSSTGRPSLVAPAGGPCPGFSLSHAGGMALCAVSMEHGVGADIESLDNVGADPLGLAELLCSRTEREALRAAPAEARPGRLLSLWTRKEAVSKALGLGARFPLSRLPLEEARTSPCWRIVTRAVTLRHLAAVAVHGTGASTVAIRFEEAALPAQRAAR
jgi:phosphopantetheinyl transferase